MRAHVGDLLTLESMHVGEPRRTGLITVLEHEDGTPPYWVRWLDNGHEAFVFPGPEAHIDPPHTHSAQYHSAVP